MKKQNENNRAESSSGSQMAPDPKNVSEMLEWLYAIHLASGTDVENKVKSLTSGFHEPTLRQIANEAAHAVKESSTNFSSRRKAYQKKELETPYERAEKLKKQRLRSISKMKYTDSVHFLTPKGQQTDLALDAFVGMSGVLNTPAKRKLLSDFEDTAKTLAKEQVKTLETRISLELENGTFSPAEMAEARAHLEHAEELVRKDTEQYSISNEAAALQEIFDLACVYILKYAANEDLSKYRDPATLKFLWNLQSTAVDNAVLSTHAEDYKTRAHGVASGTPARVAMRQFELDVIKYEWFISLISDRATIPSQTKQFKNLLVSKLESLLETRDSHLRNLVAADADILQGKKSKFDFYKFHLPLGAVAPPQAPALHFIDGSRPGEESPQEDPEQYVRAMGTKGSRPLSGKPDSKCTGESRKERYSSETTIKHKYEPPQSEDEGESSGKDTQDTKSNSRKAKQPRSNSPPPSRRASERNKDKGGGARPADPDFVRLIGDLTQQLKKANDHSRGPQAPKEDQNKRRKMEVRAPDNACRSFLAGKACDKDRCGGVHGKYSKTWKGKASTLCESEVKGFPCPFLWTKNGCFGRHTAKND